MKSFSQASEEFAAAKAEFARAFLASPLGRFITWILDRLVSVLDRWT